MITKFRVNKMTGVLRVGNERYIPHLLHQLPHKFEEIDPRDIIKMKGFIYIHTSVFPNSKLMIECLHSNRDLNYKQRR